MAKALSGNIFAQTDERAGMSHGEYMYISGKMTFVLLTSLVMKRRASLCR
jgi:hypothetical protein